MADARGFLTSPALAVVPRLSEVTHAEPAEYVARRSRAAASWARGAFALDSAMLVAAVLATELGASAAGVAPIPAVWLVAFSLAVLFGFYTRSMYDWHMRLQALDDVRA